MIDVMAIWDSSPTELKAAIVGAGATVATGALGFGAVIFQISAQGRANRRNVAETERRRLKSELYEKTVAVCADVQDAVITFSNMVRILGQNITRAGAAREAGVEIQISRLSDIMNSHTAMSNAVCDFIFMIERRQIVDRRLLIFRSAMSAVLHDINVTYQQFIPTAIAMLPADLPNGQVRFSPPPAREAHEFSDKCMTMADRSLSITTYVEDFVIEAQNLLLGDLFGKHAKHRVPIDPAARVIRLDKHEEISRELRDNTAWGRFVADADDNARDRFLPTKAPSRFGRFLRRRLTK